MLKNGWNNLSLLERQLTSPLDPIVYIKKKDGKIGAIG